MQPVLLWIISCRQFKETHRFGLSPVYIYKGVKQGKPKTAPKLLKSDYLLNNCFFLRACWCLFDFVKLLIPLHSLGNVFFILWWSSSRFLCVMSQDMSPQVSSLAEWFLTLSTRMGLFSSVCEHVFPQSSSFTEILVACCTFVRLLSSVDHKVPIQILSSTKWLVAPCTLLHFLSSGQCSGGLVKMVKQVIGEYL